MSHPSLSLLPGRRLALSLRALGASGDAWLAGLPGLLTSLATDWSLTLGAALDGGSTAYVAEALTSDGAPVVLKVSIPPPTAFQRQLTTLRLAAGDPYVGLIRHDTQRRALLLEHLGHPLATLGRPAARQLDALTRTAARGWHPVPSGTGLPTWIEAARWHAAFIPSTWAELGRPCPGRAVDLALHCAAAREAAYRPDRAVLIHGDVHNLNALHVPGAGLRLVDPSGLISEPAHDLGVIQSRGVPSRIADLAARHPHQALTAMRRSCRHAARQTGTDPEAIWQWAFIELLSTGLFMQQLGRHADAHPFLTLAGKLARPTMAARPAAPTTKTRPTAPAAAARPTPPTAEVRLPPSAAATADTQPTAVGEAAGNSGEGRPAWSAAGGQAADPGRPARVRAERRVSRAVVVVPPRRATLLLMVGLPGAGKTVRAKELAVARRALRLTTDEWMIKLFDGWQPDGKRDILEGRLIRVALQTVRLGTDVVLDFGLWSRDERSALRWLAAAAGAIGRVVYLPVDRDVQRARVAHRQATAPHTTFPMTEAELDAWRTQFEAPEAAELTGADLPGPPPGWPGWPEWAADRWPALAGDNV